MKQEEVTTDDEAKQFLQDMANDRTKFADNHLAITFLLKAQGDYDHARIGLKMNVQDALQHALDIAQT